MRISLKQGEFLLVAMTRLHYFSKLFGPTFCRIKNQNLWKHVGLREKQKRKTDHGDVSGMVREQFCNPVLDILGDKLTLVHFTAFYSLHRYAIVVEQQQIHT